MTAAFEQKQQGFMTYPEAGWRKWMFKAPLVLWRLGLGPLIGRYIMVINHTGRKSGLPHHTMVEYHKADNGKRYIVAAFGDHTQWFKNIQADPNITIQTNESTEQVKARKVTDDGEIVAVVNLFMHKNPTMTRWYLDTLDIKNTIDSILTHKDRLSFITFESTNEATPPPLEEDLKWMWWITAAVLILRLIMRGKQAAEDA